MGIPIDSVVNTMTADDLVSWADPTLRWRLDMSKRTDKRRNRARRKKANHGRKPNAGRKR